MDAEMLRLRISGTEAMATDVRAFILESTDGRAVSWEAGQFLNFVFSTPAGEVRRAYSIAASPLSNDPLRIVVKRIANGIASRRLIDRTTVGDMLFALPPRGLFTLPKDLTLYRRVYFFAAGIGITPVFSLIKTLLLMPATPPIVLVYSNRSIEEAVLRTALLALQDAHPGKLKIEWLFSNAFNAQRARLSSALMPQLLQQYATEPLASALCYTCGPADFMWMVSTLLHQYGVPLFNIRKEIFETAVHTVIRTPPDTGTRTVKIIKGSITSTLTVTYPETILEAANREGLSLPYSCKAGQCGSCLSRCTHGTIWHAYNEVLTDKDLAAGLILTCTGHPVGDGVEIRIDA